MWKYCLFKVVFIILLWKRTIDEIDVDVYPETNYSYSNKKSTGKIYKNKLFLVLVLFCSKPIMYLQFSEVREIFKRRWFHGDCITCWLVFFQSSLINIMSNEICLLLFGIFTWKIRPSKSRTIFSYKFLNTKVPIRRTSSLQYVYCMFLNCSVFIYSRG